MTPGDKAAVIEKIRKLLALSHSCNEHEAALAARHAQRMLAAHNLALADIETAASDGRAEQVELAAPRKLPKWSRLLSAGVGDAFDCRALHHPVRGVLIFIGAGADPHVAAHTYAYVERTLRRLCRTHLQGRFASGAGGRLRETARQSYYLGAVSAINSNLQEQKARTPVTPYALVPVKEGLIRAAMDSFGPVRTVHGRRSVVDGHSYRQGHEAGGRITVAKAVCWGKGGRGPGGNPR